MKKMSSMSMIAVLAIVMLGFYQCTNDDPLFSGFPTELDYLNLQEVHNEMSVSDTVQLTIADPTLENIINGPKGTKFIFPGNSLTTQGGGVAAAPVKVELIEVYKRGEMIQRRIQTFATQDPLVSGGMFWIRATDANGDELVFDGVNAILPYKTDATGYEAGIQHYLGSNQTAPSGNILSWTAGTLVVTFDGGAGVNGEFTIENVKPDWNHIAAPYAIAAGDETQFAVSVPNALDFAFTEVFFALDDFTVVSALTSVEGETLTTFAGSVPKNATGKIVAIALIEGKLNFATQDVTVTGDDLFVVNVSQGTTNELAVLLNAMN